MLLKEKEIQWRGLCMHLQPALKPYAKVKAAHYQNILGETDSPESPSALIASSDRGTQTLKK